MLRILLVLFLLLATIYMVCVFAQEMTTLETGVVKVIAQVQGIQKIGTGFIVRLTQEAAHVVTASHVVEGDKTPHVEFYTRRNLPVSAQVVGLEGGDPRGLALLAVQGKENLPAGLFALSLASQVQLRGGDELTVIGFPRLAGPWSVSRGNFVSQKGRDLLFTGAIGEGNSGGPLIKNGQVIGLVTELAESYSRATPIAIVKLFLQGWGVYPTPYEIMRGRDEKEMVLVPAGAFEMGSTEEEVEAAYQLAKQFYNEADRAWYESEKPRHWVWVNAFYMDMNKVTLGEYKVFIRETWETAHRELPEWIVNYMHSNQYPVIGVRWGDADAYCRWAGKRLPTEAQWEKAARGIDGRWFPWGLIPVDGKRANYCDANCDSPWKDKSQNDGHRYLSPVGAYELGKSFYGIDDLAGNVWEWVQDWYDSNYYRNSPERNPINEKEGQYRVVRGGSWDSDASFLRASFRGWRDPDSHTDFVGFRCALTVSTERQ
jgi:formylglycine-generating enzyme required for sulfatase activity